MINYIVLLLSVLGFILPTFFDLQFMIAVNFPLILLSRCLYIAAFYLNYVRFSQREAEELDNPLFSKKETLYFIGKNALIVILGFLHFYLAVFFAAYSLLCVGVYDQTIGEKKNAKYLYEIPGKIVYYVSPLVIALIIFLVGDLSAFMPLFFSILGFLFWGQKYAQLDLRELEKRYEKRLINKIPLFIQIWVNFTKEGSIIK
ncbi:MAG: hypothetical protein R6U96_02695 [Promethearchaeia archaeon]